jgi:hypothetical protein
LNRCVSHAAASKKFPTAGTRKQATDYRKSRLMSVEFGRALDHPIGPLIATPAIHVTPGLLQISPADERCRLGELTILQDSESPCPELSGELFTVRSTAYAG